MGFISCGFCFLIKFVAKGARLLNCKYIRSVEKSRDWINFLFGSQSDSGNALWAHFTPIEKWIGSLITNPTITSLNKPLASGLLKAMRSVANIDTSRYFPAPQIIPSVSYFRTLYYFKQFKPFYFMKRSLLQSNLLYTHPSWGSYWVLHRLLLRL